MKRMFGQVGRLKPGYIEEYRRLHEQEVFTPRWAGVLEMIRACNLRNYSIFIEGDVVFAYFEYVGEDYEADMEKMAADPTTREWWTHTHPCFMKYEADRPEDFYIDMKQIFHLA